MPVLQRVRLLNRHPLSTTWRLNVTVLLLRLVYANAVQSLQSLWPMSREIGWLSETKATRNLLEAIGEVARTPVVSCELIFRNDQGARHFAKASIPA